MAGSNSRAAELFSPLVHLCNNWISQVGVILATTGGILWLFLLPTYLKGQAGSAYLGILLYLALPGVFFAGLVLIPIGMLVLRRRKRRTGITPQDLPPLNWENADFRRLASFIALATFANLVIGSQFSYRAVEYMDSVQFCGQACHAVMKPEFTAYQNSPHSRVECVKCHIGPGAGWFVRSKLSGAWQVVSVAFDLYPRPIPTPVENLRPARETCEGCHWPDKYGGQRLRVLTNFGDDGQRTKTVLLMHIGGGDGGRTIHGAHVGGGIRVRYAHADPARQTIPWIEYSRNGATVEYLASGAKKEDVAKWSIREMDCMDCHNRPSHAFEAPERALNAAMAAGSVDPSLPMVKKQALEILQADYATSQEAAEKIPAAFVRYYESRHPDVLKSRKSEIERSARGLLAIYERNVFPEMRVRWGTYPNNVGHTDFPGCFRCHDNDHNSAAGKSVSQDCTTCHSMLAVDEAEPKILSELGVVTN